MPIEQDFWCFPGQETYPGGPRKNSSRMYRQDDFIFYERNSFDREDDREYEYRGRFLVTDYRQALQALQETGRATLAGIDPRGKTDTPSVELTLKKISEDYVELIFSGSSFSCCPGGAHVGGSLHDHHKLGRLLLNE